MTMEPKPQSMERSASHRLYSSQIEGFWGQIEASHGIPIPSSVSFPSSSCLLPWSLSSFNPGFSTRMHC
uniref:Uncharacterized protein n=1 Tax=Lotus japonicus TaxID=34305 RepID=I3S4M6_LOTJA|nr:unknown [Lotus japonicus]